MDRIPPQNIEAEQSLLGCLLLDTDAMTKISDTLRVENFYRETHAQIFDAMLSLYSKHQPIDLLTLTNELQEQGKLEFVGGRSYLVELSTIVPSAAHISHYAQIISRKATLRRLIQAASGIVEESYVESKDVDVILDESEQKLFSVSQGYLKHIFIPMRTLLGDAFERIDQLHKNKGQLRGIATGFSDLDHYLAGLQRSDLVILAARPSLGKTSLAMDIARNAAVLNKVPVGIFSLEMSKEQLVDRMICAHGGIDLWKLRTGRLSDEPTGAGLTDFDLLRNSIQDLSEAPIYIDDSGTANVMEIRTKARRLQIEKGLGLLVIDYLQLMEGRNQSEGRVQEVSEISRSLKSIARELNIPVLALSQLSRASEARTPAIPKLSDLRESGCLAGDTLLMRADTGELVPLHSLVSQTNIPIFSLNQNLQLEKRIITKIFSSGRKKLFELKTRSGRSIKASANHPFYTMNGWKQLDALTTGMSVAIPRSYKPQGWEISMKDDELVLLAHLIGDGCVLPKQPIHYTSADPKNIRAVSDAAQRLFAITPRIIQQKNWWHVYLPSPYRLTHNTYHPITLWYNELGLERVRSYHKQLPAKLFTASQRQIQFFLHHLWATDGNISWKLLHGRKRAGAIYYATTSSLLAMQVQHLLLRLGIMSTLRTVQQTKGVKRYRSCYQVHVQGSVQQLLFCRIVGSFGNRGEIVSQMIKELSEIQSNPNTDKIPKEAWRTLVNPARLSIEMPWRTLSASIQTAYCGSTLFESGLSRERMGRVATVLKNPMLLSLSTSDIYWDEISAVTELGVEEVFDATVPGTHNFVANDFIVHNSIEQDADVVMFIYRKVMDRGIKDVPAAERHVAEIYIAKHRNGPTGTVELYFDEERVTFRNLEKHHALDVPF